MDINNICVFCSASQKIEPQYFNLAYTFGKQLAEAGIGLVYGGANIGMMGRVADGCIDHGGTTHGVTTEYLNQYEGKHDRLQKIEVAPDMHTRKKIMFENSDGIVVLPGGFGTLDETLEVLTWKQIGLHDKPILVLNYKDFWSPLQKLIETIISHNFATETDGKLIRFVSDVDEVIPLMQSLPRIKINPTTKWL